MLKLKKKETTVVPKVITQHCIKSHFFNEVMKLPEDVTITSIVFECGFAIKRQSQQIPVALAGCGVSAIRKSDPSMEVEGKLTGKRSRMIKDIATICKELDLKTNTVRVKRMTLTVGNDLGVFQRMQKMLPSETNDKLKRVTVLGLVKWDGDEVKIANTCNAKAFKCKYDTQIIRTVICEEG